MKKFIFLAAFAAWNALGQLTVGIVPYDGVVVVSGAMQTSTPVVYNQPVVYEAPVHYDGPVTYNGPVIYNNGNSVNINSAQDQTPQTCGYYDSGYSPVIYVGAEACGYGNCNYRRNGSYSYYGSYSSCNPDITYIGRHSVAHGGYYLRAGR